jgi:hypothetical protein
VAFLGASITEMAGWRNHVASRLRKRFPQTTFEFIYGGIGSTDSTMGAYLDIAAAALGEGWHLVKRWAPTQGGTRKQFVNLPLLETTTHADASHVGPEEHAKPGHGMSYLLVCRECEVGVTRRCWPCRLAVTI